jgi:membrane-associated protease RseP (regulator of RpoE activity)
LSANDELDAAVKSFFTVKDYFVTEEGLMEYKVAYEPASRERFLSLLDRLRPSGQEAQLYGTAEDATLVVTKRATPPATARASVFLFFLTLLSVIVTGYVMASIFPQVAPKSSPIEMGIGFEAGLFAFLLGREAAQRYAARKGSFSPLAYYLPNLPLITPLPVMYFLPTFGSISFPRTPAANRDRLFDYYLVGSLAGVAVSAVVAFLGAGSSVVLTHAQYAALQAGNQTTLTTNPSLLQSAILAASAVAGLSQGVPAGGSIIFSPIEIAAWLGLLISFFNLMPAALFDGGRMARLSLGERGSRVTTIVCGLLLLVTDVPDYWVVFLIVFLMAAFPVRGDTLDSISGLSRSRKALFAAAVVLGLLCVPLPQSIATMPI